MNRRGFLKKCSLLPFIGSLATVGQAVASKDKSEPEFIGPLAQFYAHLSKVNDIEDDLYDIDATHKIFNGQIFEAPWPHGSFNPFYTQRELKDWKLANSKLIMDYQGTQKMT